MKRYVAFLRGMNLGRRRLPMSRLRSLFEDLGFHAVETFIASGNVLFSTRATEPGRLETRIARHLEASLGYGVDTFVRTLDEVAALAGATIFTEEGEKGVSVHVGLLKEPLPLETACALQAVRTAEDEFRVLGREYYWLRRVGVSPSTVWTRPEVRALKLPTSTLRKMTSLRRLVARHVPLSPE